MKIIPEINWLSWYKSKQRLTILHFSAENRISYFVLVEGRNIINGKLTLSLRSLSVSEFYNYEFIRNNINFPVVRLID
jgi:uncharacterized membrane protein